MMDHMGEETSFDLLECLGKFDQSFENFTIITIHNSEQGES